MIGSQVGKWTVIGPGRASLYYRCRCECGTEKDVNKKNLKAGLTSSCGCYRIEVKKTHGMSRSKTYEAWQRVIDRTTNPNTPRYADYGGRGIKVCERWLESFENFLTDMGVHPGPNYSLDRIDNDGNYEPSNCRWATRSNQQRNKRTTKLYAFRGKEQCAAAWAEEYGMKLNTLLARLDRGKSIEEALTKDVGVPRGKSGTPPNKKPIEYDGRTQTAEEWAAEFGLPISAFLGRREDGWSMDRIKHQPFKGST